MALHKLNNIDPATLASNPRATLSAWLKYESYILAAYAQHPRPYMFRPVSMSAQTVCTKIRDAIRGGIAFSYSDRVTSAELTSWWKETSVSVKGDTVIIGPRTEASLPLNANVSDGTLRFPTLSVEELNAFHLLISHGLIPGGVVITSLDDAILSSLLTRSNVEVFRRSDGSVVLL